MTDEQVKMLADAIHELAKAIAKVGDCISQDEPLNYSLARRLAKVARP